MWIHRECTRTGDATHGECKSARHDARGPVGQGREVETWIQSAGKPNEQGAQKQAARVASRLKRQGNYGLSILHRSSTGTVLLLVEMPSDVPVENERATLCIKTRT
jgi:hypothetical protein